MRYHFLEFLLDTDRFELYRNETRLAAEPQVIELLTLLLEQRQRMVSKDEIYVLEAKIHLRLLKNT